MQLQYTSSTNERIPSLNIISFAQLFKRYRLRAEFDTYAKFSDALVQKGFFYDTSIFCHWQKGTRKPSNREVVLSMIEIFIENDSMRSLPEANEFLASTGLGYLTDAESQKLSVLLTTLSMNFISK